MQGARQGARQGYQQADVAEEGLDGVVEGAPHGPCVRGAAGCSRCHVVAPDEGREKGERDRDEDEEDEEDQGD